MPSASAPIEEEELIAASSVDEEDKGDEALAALELAQMQEHERAQADYNKQVAEAKLHRSSYFCKPDYKIPSEPDCFKIIGTGDVNREDDFKVMETVPFGVYAEE